MLFLNRVYFRSNVIKQVLISSVLLFLFSYSFYSVGRSTRFSRRAKTSVIMKAKNRATADYKKVFAVYEKAYAVYEKSAAAHEKTHTAQVVAAVTLKKADAAAIKEAVATLKKADDAHEKAHAAQAVVGVPLKKAMVAVTKAEAALIISRR